MNTLPPSQSLETTLDSLPSSEVALPCIQVLPPFLVNRIAAGEVVERPANVVKELVENAIDAGATRVDIAVLAGGKCLRVVDNGCGMGAEDIATAFLNHATSKIRSPEDLDAIATLGFRGEALASISAISRFTCTSRQRGADHGWCYRIEGGGSPSLEAVGCSEGTIMQVEDLFFNTPARLKFLKRPETEMAAIEEMLQGLALSHPHVQVRYECNNKQVFHSQGSPCLKSAVQNILRLSDAEAQGLLLADTTMTLHEVPHRVQALLANPAQLSLQKRSKKTWWMLLNGRHVRCPILSRAIQQAYESLVPHGMYPLCVLWLTLPPSLVDVNVHPTKKEVRYVKGNDAFQAVQQGLRQALVAQFEQTYQLPHTPSFQPLGLHAQQPQAFESPSAAPSNAPPFVPLPSSRGLGQPAFPAALAPSQVVSATDSLALSAPLPLLKPSLLLEAEADTPPLQLRRWRVIGQLMNTYALVETPQGLLVVDQHIASERWVFEKLMLQGRLETPQVQRLLIPKLLRLSSTQVVVFESVAAWLASVGYDCELLAGQQLAIHSFPLLYPERVQVGIESQVEALLTQLEATGQAEPDVEQLISTLACHSAIRAGDVLNQQQLERLINDWLTCTLPWSCPHGRPIAHTLESAELNRWFDRPSLPQ